MKQILLFLVVIFSLSVFSQSNSRYNKIWESILLNDREKALKFSEKISYDKADIEGIILKQLILTENGYVEPDKEFISSFVLQPDFDKYLYAMWNEGFMFGDYVSNGLIKYGYENINYIQPEKIKQPEVKAPFLYLKAISKRAQNKHQEFINYLDQINHVNKWQYCGVFEDLNKSGINIPYPPENYAFSREDFDANSNGKINWYIPANHVEVYQYFVNHSEYGDGINYAQSFIHNDQEQVVYLKIGTGSAIKLWLNDVLIFENTKDRGTEMDAYIIKLNLPEGINRLLVKTTNFSYNSYFIVRITDEKGNPVKGIYSSEEYQPYNKSTVQSLNPVLLAHPVEQFFEKKVEQYPDNFFLKYCLANTYLRNSKIEKFNTLLSPLLEKYPKSSLLRRLKIKALQIEKDYNKISEIYKNMELDDEMYYVVQALKMTKFEEILKKDKAEMRKDLDKIREALHFDLAHATCDFLEAARDNNMDRLKKILDRLIKDAFDIQNPKLITIYAPIYKNLFNDEEKTIEILNRVINDYYHYLAYDELVSIYNEKNEDEKVVELLKKFYLVNKEDNKTLYYLTSKLYEMQHYKEALQYIDSALMNFPYSFMFMEEKAKNYLQLKNKKEALKWYKKSLSHNTGSYKLRKTVDDLENREDPLKGLIIQNVYKFIRENRNKVKKNNYGINVLLEDFNNLIYKEGGIKERAVLIYEVTSDNGVEILKEYDMGLTGNYTIYKSELVKPDGSIVPADKQGSHLVFKNLKPGDVVYIDYEKYVSGSGRFYKDFTGSFSPDFYHPASHVYYRVLFPKDYKLNYEYVNGEIDFIKKKKDEWILYQWSDEHVKCMPASEDYMPEFIDVIRSVHISSINSWQDIARWYSDLMSSSIKFDETVEKVFKELFPNSYESLSENERAKIIYDYIITNINYSYVDFRQSGYIPQRPSKTIDTKLGDCKDLSTLFLALGRKAGLKVNLVLVLTNDNGFNELVLPSMGFNHAIVKVMIDGKEQFLELTNKYLPYKTLPVTLINASALEIPYEKEEIEQKNLFHLENLSQTVNVLQSDAEYIIEKETQKIKIKTKGKGRGAARLNRKFSDIGKDVIEKKVVKYFTNLQDIDLELIDYEIINSDATSPEAEFNATLHIKNQINNLGSIKVFKLPLQLNPYTQDIVNLKKRNYPIEYTKYEYLDFYKYSYRIVLKNGGKFSIIPKNQSYRYKNHSFDIKYEQVSDTVLKVKVQAHTPLDRINPEEYPEFRKYVNNVLKATQSLIGFE